MSGLAVRQRGISVHRIGAMILRYWYLLMSSWPRLLELIYWPALQIITWGFLQNYISQTSGFFARAGGTLIDRGSTSHLVMVTAHTRHPSCQNYRHKPTKIRSIDISAGSYAAVSGITPSTIGNGGPAGLDLDPGRLSPLRRLSHRLVSPLHADTRESETMRRSLTVTIPGDA